MYFKYFNLIFTIFFISQGINSQSIDFIHRNISIEQGLPESTVLDIVEDELGFIWIATPNFLSRFDGSDFKVFPKPFDFRSGTENFKLGKLYVDGQRLWMITKGGKLEFMDLVTETIYTVEKFQNTDEEIPELRCLLLDHPRIYLGTENKGLIIMDSNFDFIGNFDKDTYQKLLSNKVNDVIKDGDNFLIMTNLGVNEIKSGAVREFLPGINFFKALSLDNTNTIALGSLGQGLWKKHQALNNYFPYNFGTKQTVLNTGSVTSFYFNSDAAYTQWPFWYGTLENGLILEDLHMSLYEVNLAKGPKNILCLHGSEFGQLYIGTQGEGIYVIDKNIAFNFEEIKLPQDFPNVNFLSYSSSNTISLRSSSTNYISINIDSSSTEEFDLKNYLNQYFGQVNYKCFLTNDANKMFVLSDNSEYFMFDIQKRELENLGYFTFEELDELLFEYEPPIIISPKVNNNKVVFIFKSFGYLLDFDKKSTKKSVFPLIKEIKESDNGDFLLILKNGDLGWLDVENFEFSLSSTFQELIPEKTEITDIKILNGWIWVSTLGDGIYLANLESGFKTHWNSESGLPNDFIMAIEFADTRTVWCSSNRGLFRLNFRTEKNSIYIENIQYFNFKNGLPFNEFGQKASFRRSDGKICFLSDNKILCLDSITENWLEIPSNLVITQIKANNEVLKFDSESHFLNEIELNYDQNSLEFNFSALNKTVPENNNYSYKLEGLDKEWIISGSKQFASYSNLNPGQYIFKVKLTNENYPGAPFSELLVTIKAAFWQTVWFKLLVTIIVVFSFYSIYRLKMNQMLKIQKVKDEISADLHDDLGARLTTMHLLSNIQKNRNNDSSEIADFLTKIEKEVQESSEALHELVSSIKMKETELDEFLSKLRRELSESLDQSNIRYSIEIDERLENVNLNLNKRKDILFISKELINNIRKHSCCQKVEVQYQHTNDAIYFSVKDDGNGFDPAGKKKRNGLEIIKNRVSKCNGKIEISSSIGKGVHTQIWIPLEKVGLIYSIKEKVKSYLP